MDDELEAELDAALAREEHTMAAARRQLADEFTFVQQGTNPRVVMAAPRGFVGYAGEPTVVPKKKKEVLKLKLRCLWIEKDGMYHIRIVDQHDSIHDEWVADTEAEAAGHMLQLAQSYGNIRGDYGQAIDLRIRLERGRGGHLNRQQREAMNRRDLGDTGEDNFALAIDEDAIARAEQMSHVEWEHEARNDTIARRRFNPFGN